MSGRGKAVPANMKQLLDPSAAKSSRGGGAVSKPAPVNTKAGGKGPQKKEGDTRVNSKNPAGAAKAKPGGSGAANVSPRSDKGTVANDDRHTLPSTLPVWLWIWHVEKRRMNTLSRESSVNYTVRVREGDTEPVEVDVFRIGPQATPSVLADAAAIVKQILAAGKNDFPVAIDVTGFELEAEEHVATNQTGCFVCQSPDDRTVLVGPFKEALMVYALINPDADIDALARKLGKRIGYKEKPPPPPKPPTPPPPTPPKPKRVFTDGPVTILPTKNTKEGLLADKYLWMFLKHAFPDRIKKIIAPYKPKEYTDDEYTIINLVPNNSGGPQVQKRLFDFVHEYERKCAHHVITVKDPLHQKQVDEVARASKLSLIVHEEAIVHIVTLGEKMDETKQIIYDILAGRYGAKEEPEPPVEDDKERNKYVRKLKFKYDARADIHIFEGNLTNLRVDAIVNPANSALHNSDGISKAIARAAGAELDNECKMRVANKGRLQITKNYVSRSYHLPCKHVIHMVGPMWKSYDDKEKCEKHLYQTFANCLTEAAKLKLKTLGLPVDNSVLWGVPLDMAIKHLSQAVTNHLKQNKKSSITSISLIDLNKIALNKLQAEFTSRTDDVLVLESG